MSKKQNIFSSFSYAGSGIKEAFKSEPNFRIHIVMGLLSVILGIFFKFSLEKFAILALTICFVIVLELINTVIEKLVDAVSPNFSPEAKVIKDLSAGIVLISALSAIAVGLLLYLPSILRLLSFGG